MNRILLLCVLAAVPAFSSAAQTRTGSVTITLNFVREPASCSISTAAVDINFGTFTSPRSGTVRQTSPEHKVTVTGKNTSSIAASFANSFGQAMTNSDDDAIPFTASARCSTRTGCPGSASSGFARERDCDCHLSATAIIPAQAPAGSYDGTSTVTVTCLQ